MNPVDEQVVTRKAKLILQDLEKLEDYAEMATKEQYCENVDAQLAVERLLERILMRLIDINYHVLSQKYMFVPKDYTESFGQMREAGEITGEMYEQMKGAAGLRNVLSHQYDEIDPELVYEGMQNTVKYVRGYLKQVLAEN